MKKAAYLLIAFFVFCLAMPLVLFLTPARAADSGACYAINDPDARSYCIARARRDTSACYTIQRSDMRSQCLAEVRK